MVRRLAANKYASGGDTFYQATNFSVTETSDEPFVISNGDHPLEMATRCVRRLTAITIGGITGVRQLDGGETLDHVTPFYFGIAPF